MWPVEERYNSPFLRGMVPLKGGLHVSSCKFYVVDDDPAVRRMLERIIVDRELGNVVGISGDGVKAEAEIMDTSPDIVIVDLLMPRQDGLQTIRNLKRSGYHGAFIMLSQVSDKKMVEKAYQEGIEFYISKPLNLVEVVSVVRKVLSAIKVRSTLHSIHSTIASLDPCGERVIGCTLRDRLEERRRQAKHLCGELGILGEAGSEDLVVLAVLSCNEPGLVTSGLDPRQLYVRLADYYRQQTYLSRSVNPKAIEQRLRRAALTSLRQLASIGLEDYGDPRFERFSSVFFDFSEVRAEMARLQGKAARLPRISLRKFIEAFILELDKPST